MAKKKDKDTEALKLIAKAIAQELEEKAGINTDIRLIVDEKAVLLSGRAHGNFRPSIYGLFHDYAKAGVFVATLCVGDNNLTFCPAVKVSLSDPDFMDKIVVIANNCMRSQCKYCKVDILMTEVKDAD